MREVGRCGPVWLAGAGSSMTSVPQQRCRLPQTTTTAAEQRFSASRRRRPGPVRHPGRPAHRAGPVPQVDIDLSAKRLYPTCPDPASRGAEALAQAAAGELRTLADVQLGRTAAQVGWIRAVRETDYVLPSYREHAAALTPGDRTRCVSSSSGGAVARDGSRERCIVPHLDLLGTQALHAMGAAMASTWLGDGGVTVAFVGDGATSEGDVHEALNSPPSGRRRACSSCRTTAWAISTPDDGTSAGRRRWPAGRRATACPASGSTATTSSPSTPSRRPRRPSGSARVTGPHADRSGHLPDGGATATADDPTRYRSDEDTAVWRPLDPLVRCRADTCSSDAGTDQAVRPARIDLRGRGPGRPGRRQAVDPFDEPAGLAALLAELLRRADP